MSYLSKLTERISNAMGSKSATAAKSADAAPSTTPASPVEPLDSTPGTTTPEAS